MKELIRLSVISTFIVLISSVQAKNVLWDTSHGIYLDYEPSGRFQPLVQNLVLNGFSVDTTNRGFLVDDPTGYDVIVVCAASAWDSTYSSSEVVRIMDFVNSGGGLLIMGENTTCPNANIQPVASVFGVSLGLSLIEPLDTYTSDLASHPVFNGVNEICMRAAGEISASAPLTELAWQEATGEALVAAGTYGNGRIVAIGDTIFADTAYYNQVDDRLFSINTFEYLVAPEPATMCLLGLGGLAMLRRRRA